MSRKIVPFVRVGCKRCDRLACVCNVQATHKETCRYRVSTQCPVAVACEHGFDVCPICDPCTCNDPEPEDDDSLAPTDNAHVGFGIVLMGTFVVPLLWWGLPKLIG
jgi:hypothetical protein